MTDTKNPNKINPTPTSTQMKPEVEGIKNGAVLESIKTGPTATGPVLESVKTLPAAESSNTQKMFSKVKNFMPKISSNSYTKGLVAISGLTVAAWYLTPEDFKQDAIGKVKDTYDKHFGDGQSDS